MNTRVSREFAFQAAIHYEDSFIINSYHLDMSMDVTTEDIREQNIALDRIKYLLSECFENCVFIEFSETKAIDAYLKAGLKVCQLPEEPFDQIVAAVLLSKFNTVTEKKLFISEIKIRSSICDDVTFYVTSEEDIEFYGSPNVWWTENNASIFDTNKRTKKEKIVELRKEPIDWNSIGLSWKEKKSTSKDNGEIVFIPLDK